MTNATQSELSHLDTLSHLLLGTLDEKIFFSEICKHLKSQVNSERVIIYQVLSDASAIKIAINGEYIGNGEHLNKGEGPAGHVIRTKRAYFSNNVARDPLFTKEASEGIQSELCIPVIIDGLVISTIHFQNIKDQKEFSRDDITSVFKILDQLKAPLSNMKMYLSAKYLNESLLKKIEEKEKELRESKVGFQVASNFKVEEKTIIGKSEVITSLFHISDKLAKNDVNLLLEGEAGVGKGLFARRIHCRSSRAEGPFIALDCSSLSEDQLERELFGEEAGGFNNNALTRKGLIESANKGTLFLSNISRLPLSVQSKISSFFRERMAFRVKGQVPYRSDIRIIASSHESLEELVEKGLFREDLFYALNTMTLTIPSLRERRDDIEILANYFLNHGHANEVHKSLSPGAISALSEYTWPGNIRELQNVMERAYILCDGIIVERNHLAESVFNHGATINEEEEEEIDFSEMTLDELERRHICRTLEHLGGNKTKTAKTLGITVKTLYNKLHSYGMISSRDA